jgi:hypothetical protein
VLLPLLETLLETRWVGQGARACAAPADADQLSCVLQARSSSRSRPAGCVCVCVVLADAFLMQSRAYAVSRGDALQLWNFGTCADELLMLLPVAE